MQQFISRSILDKTDLVRESYQTAQPFKHICLEDFLQPEFVEELWREFPAFDAGKARSEMGKVGGKAVNTNLPSIGPAYSKFYDYMRSRDFLDAMSRMLGIPDLLFDPAMYGGGTHENLDGQELDPHVDFNYEPIRRLHRRVNLLIYLNKEWDIAWGGGIELHSNPRDWGNDQVKVFNCTFNRCVIFETNEHSWHGFSRINLPKDKQYLSRKCISVYLYTKTRPKDEIAPPHGTFYVQRPLPARFAAGHTLTTEDTEELKRLLLARDGWIKYYQDAELRLGRERASVGAYLSSMLAKVGRRVYGKWKRIVS